jgi:predicted RNA-binding Zn ribbon-like protein
LVTPGVNQDFSNFRETNGRMKAKRFAFIGGFPCLDFLNTASLGKPAGVETLRNFDDLLDWLSEARVIGARDRRGVLRRWNRGPEAQRALARAFVLRKSLQAMSEGIRVHRAVPRSTIAAIRDALATIAGAWNLTTAKTGFALKFRLRFDNPEHLLGPIAQSACDLLCNRDWSRLKRCANPACGLYFYDSTRNRRRRWCSIETCGNRMKVAAYRARSANHAHDRIRVEAGQPRPDRHAHLRRASQSVQSLNNERRFHQILQFHQ